MIKTRVYKAEELNNESVQKDIKDTILSGQVIVFPTETVYGIGASALNEKGVQNIYRVKGRPNDNPLIMHISSKEDIGVYTKNHQPYVDALIQAFWPGPMTLVMEKKDIVPDVITGGLDTVGIRYPSNDVALKLIDVAGVPICAPSANISGRPSSTLFEHVYEDFNHKVPIIIDGGKSDVGLESTVIDVTTQVPVILRPGMITKSMVEAIVPHVEISTFIAREDIPKAPGMKYKHYAPKGRLMIVSGDLERVKHYIQKKIQEHQRHDKKVGVIVTQDIKDTFDCDKVFVIGDLNDELMIASNLFAGLREMDSAEVDYIYCLSFEKGLYGEAIMNRLLKAANHNIVYLEKK
jgi:L-threonylcarbamoyladenylate synthase